MYMSIVINWLPTLWTPLLFGWLLLQTSDLHNTV